MMSIALERNSSSSSNTNRIEGGGGGSGFMTSCKSTRFESKDSMAGIMNGEDQKFPMTIKTMKVEVEEEEEEEKEEEELLDSSSSSSSSSSIGRNSDCSERSDDDDDDETEVQSKYKGGPFDSMDSLEEVLPIRKGISRFYSGKSKSYTSLADASTSSSVKEFAKPDNAYSKKRRNLLACSIILDKNRSYPLRSNGGGISKRMNTSRSTLALGVAMSNSESNNTSENSGSPPRTRPPLHPQAKQAAINSTPTSPPPSQRTFSSWRSFSLTDLQCVAAATSNPSMTNSSCLNNSDKNKKQH